MRAIFAPLAEEIKRLRALMEVDTTMHLQPGTLWCGRIGPHDVCLGQSGPGERALATLATYCFRQLRPTHAVLIGFAGATAPQLMQGDLVVATSLIAGTQQLTPSATLDPAELTALGEHLSLRTMAGPHVITAQVVGTPHAKADLGTQHHALAVATEGYEWARAAQEYQIPWCSVRAIFDPMDAPLPFDCALVKPDGTLAIGALLEYLCRHPNTIPRLSHHYYGARKGREVLTTFVKGWLAERRA